MSCPGVRFSLLLSLLLAAGATAATGEPSVRELLEQVGIPPEGDRRGQMDIVGYATTAEQMDRVISEARRLAADRSEALRRLHDIADTTAFVAAVSPHDDYCYAARLYSLLLPHVRAKRVILFGVFHKARLFHCRDRLVFDSFRTWRGPYGPVKVSSIREEILARLPEKDRIIDNDMQVVEHSVEGIVPWLQAYNRQVEIVSILVPQMAWPTIDRLSGDLAGVLALILQEKGWRLGRDVALVVSSDAVHYGDAGWGGASYAEFGTGIRGYEAAVERDRRLAREDLCGALGTAKLRRFLERCVDAEDITKYRITWCGRFSIPFGLSVVERLARNLGSDPPNGILLDYGTSVGEASIDVEGIGPTAPNDFHHFVGYAAIGYE